MTQPNEIASQFVVYADLGVTPGPRAEDKEENEE